MNRFIATVAAIANAVANTGGIELLRGAASVLAKKQSRILPCASGGGRLIAPISAITIVIVDRIFWQL